MMIDKETLKALREFSKQLGGPEVVEIQNNSKELERLKTTCLAQEAEIARLQAGFDELKNTCESVLESTAHDDYGRGIDSALRSILRQINRITGENK